LDDSRRLVKSEFYSSAARPVDESRAGRFPPRSTQREQSPFKTLFAFYLVLSNERASPTSSIEK
jgi:hypothetical protein